MLSYLLVLKQRRRQYERNAEFFCAGPIVGHIQNFTMRSSILQAKLSANAQQAGCHLGAHFHRSSETVLISKSCPALAVGVVPLWTLAHPHHQKRRCLRMHQKTGVYRCALACCRRSILTHDSCESLHYASRLSLLVSVEQFQLK